MPKLRIASLIVALAAYGAVAYLVHLCTMQPSKLQWSLWVTGAIAALFVLGGFFGAVGLFGIRVARHSPAA